MESLFKITWVGVLIAVIAVVILIDFGEAKKGKHKDAREEEAQALQGDIENGVSPSFIMPRLLDLLHRVSRAGNCPECRTKKGCWGSGGKCQKSTTSCNGTTVDVGCPGDDCECCIPYSSNTLHSKFCKPRRSCRRLNGTCMADCEKCNFPNKTRIYSACKGNCFCCAPSTLRISPIPSPSYVTYFSSCGPFSPCGTSTPGISSSITGPSILTTFPPTSFSSPTITESSSGSSSTTGPATTFQPTTTNPVPTTSRTNPIPISSFDPTPAPYHTRSSSSSSSSSIPGKTTTPNPTTTSNPTTTPPNPTTIPNPTTTTPTPTTTTPNPTTTTPNPTTTTPNPTTTTPNSTTTTPNPTTTTAIKTTTPEPTTTAPVRCAPGFFPLGDECFRVIEEESSWGRAETDCRQLGSKHVFLAEPKDSAALAQYMYDNGYSQQHHYWMGGRGDGRSIKWRKTGQTIPPSEPWQDGQPSGVTRNDCLDLRIDFVTIPLGLIKPLAVHTCSTRSFHCYICESSLRL